MQSLIKQNDYEIVQPEMPLREAAKLMAREGIHALYVCIDQKPIGVVTHIDFVYAIAEGKNLDLVYIMEICKKPVLAVKIEESLENIKSAFEITRFILLPVVDEKDTLIGAISKHELFEQMHLKDDSC